MKLKNHNGNDLVNKLDSYNIKIMILKPLYDRVLVKCIKENIKNKNGIILPEEVKEKPIKAKVISVGIGKINNMGKINPLIIKKGDIVIFQKWNGVEIDIEGINVIAIKEKDIIGIINYK